MVQDLVAQEIKLGSKALKEALPYGAAKHIAIGFNCSDSWIGKVLSGRQKGDPKIIECAEELAEAQVKFQEKFHSIINKYAPNGSAN